MNHPGAERGRYFRSLSRRSQVVFSLAVFFTFAALGPVMLSTWASEYVGWKGIVAWGAVTGLIAIGWALSFQVSRALIPVVVVFQIGAPFLLMPIMGVPGYDASRHLSTDPWDLALAATAIGLLVTGYCLFVSFFRGEGANTLRLQAEIALAQQIHRTLVPPISVATPALEIHGRSIPSSEVGGDLVDIVVTGGATDLFLADVSGHGVRAGVGMAMIKTAVRTRLLAGGGLDALLRDINRVLSDLLDPGMFATFACLRFRDGAPAEYALAGHLPILVVRADGRAEEFPNDRLPLGVDGSEEFIVGTIDFRPGDVFAVLTDGLTEARDAGGRQFGLAGVRASLAVSAREPLGRAFEALLADVSRHGTPDDDQTLVLGRVLR